MSTLASRLAALCVRGFETGRIAIAAPAFGAAVLLTGGFVAFGLSSDNAEAKTPGKTYCFHGKCHRVKTLAETQALVGAEETVMASHYDSCKVDRYNPCGLTSSGEVFRANAPDNAASPIYPDGTTLLVWSPDTRASIVLRVNNAGPYWGNRKLDVSRGAAEVLGFAGRGVAPLKVRVIAAPDRAQATYKRNRRYDPVPGFIGHHASLDEAQSAAATAYMVAGLVSPFPASELPGGGAVTVVAGAFGTQSGPAVSAPTVLAEASVPSVAAVSVSAEVASVASAPSDVKLEQVAALAATAQSAASPAEAQAVAPAETTPRVRSSAERTSERNSRAYRVAARKQKSKGQPHRVAQRSTAPQRATAAAAEQRPAPGKRPLIKDGTNDMSVFSRHVHAGMERIASQQPMRRGAY